MSPLPSTANKGIPPEHKKKWSSPKSDLHLPIMVTDIVHKFEMISKGLVSA